MELFKKKITGNRSEVTESEKVEYGYYQTPPKLANSVTRYLAQKINPDIIIEPTCGRGHFIVAALASFDNLDKIIAVEIHKPYVW